MSEGAREYPKIRRGSVPRSERGPQVALNVKLRETILAAVGVKAKATPTHLGPSVEDPKGNHPPFSMRSVL